jgi:hypothetical protein
MNRNKKKKKHVGWWWWYLKPVFTKICCQAFFTEAKLLKKSYQTRTKLNRTEPDSLGIKCMRNKNWREPHQCEHHHTLTHPVWKHDQKIYTEKVCVNRAILCNAQICCLPRCDAPSLPRGHAEVRTSVGGSNQCGTVTWFGRLEPSVLVLINQNWIKIETKKQDTILEI